jgi:hypothetical protein
MSPNKMQNKPTLVYIGVANLDALANFSSLGWTIIHNSDLIENFFGQAYSYLQAFA